MTWLLPSALALAAGVALAALALHFIARTRPLAEPLPTARFIPGRPLVARMRTTALSDVMLLVVRVAVVFMIGAAVAGPVVMGRGRTVRILVADRSRAVADIAELRDSVRALSAGANALVLFDSTAFDAPPPNARTSGTLFATGARGSLSAGLAAAMSAAARTASPADSIELVLISPVADEEIDEATMRLRAAWPGRIRLVPVHASVAESEPLHAETTADVDDVVAAGLSLVGENRASGAARVVREIPTRADSAWARVKGHVLLHWPATDTSADWPVRSVIDAIGGVTSGGGTLVARFPRLWLLEGNAIARWADGETAAVEHAAGDGCIRQVGILIDPASDITLRPSFRRFVSGLLKPCGGAGLAQSARAVAIASLTGYGSLAPASGLRDAADESSRWTPWLLGVAALLLIAELVLRRSRRRAA